MGCSNVYDFMSAIASRGLRNQRANPGDYMDEEGILVCGVCSERRQGFVEVDSPTDDDPHRKVRMKVVTSCRCDREREAEEKRKKENQEAMELVERLKKASLMDEKFKGVTFATFQINKHNARNLKLCKRYVDAFDEMVEKN